MGEADGDALGFDSGHSSGLIDRLPTSMDEIQPVGEFPKEASSKAKQSELNVHVEIACGVSSHGDAVQNWTTVEDGSGDVPTWNPGRPTFVLYSTWRFVGDTD